MVHAHHYVVPTSPFAVVLVGTASKSFDGPARNLYSRLAESLKRDGVTALQVSLCNAENMDEAVHDVRHGIQYLCGLGSKTVMLVGYDLGGTAVLHSSVEESCVLGVVAIAPADPGEKVRSTRPLLIVYGDNDAVTGARQSKGIFERAAEPKELRVIEGAGHSLDEATDELHEVVYQWLVALRDAHHSQAA
jgi:dienelactone hydrolase